MLWKETQPCQYLDFRLKTLDFSLPKLEDHKFVLCYDTGCGSHVVLEAAENKYRHQTQTPHH